MKIIIAFSIAAACAAAGCGKKISANVKCAAANGPAVNCTITQTEGTAEIEVCWDFKLTCDNGASLETARTCGNVKDGKETKVMVASDKITVTGSCDKVKDGLLTNMSWKRAGKKTNE